MNEPKDLADLADQFGKPFAPGWRPAIHEVLQGIVTGLSSRNGYNDVEYPIVIVQTADGNEVAIHGFHAVLRSQLAENNPAVGDRIALRYEGRIRAKAEGHDPYHGYSFAIERNAVAAEPSTDDDIPFG